MKKNAISLMLIALISINASAEILRMEERSLEYDAYQDPSEVYVPPTVSIDNVTIVNAKIAELRNAIFQLRELLQETDDPALQIEYEYQIRQLESELASITRSMNLDNLTLFQEIMQQLSNLLKMMQDLSGSIIRNFG
jgi:hypothetical protein